jgi:hypothetical protein
MPLSPGKSRRKPRTSLVAAFVRQASEGMARLPWRGWEDIEVTDADMREVDKLVDRALSIQTNAATVQNITVEITAKVRDLQRRLQETNPMPIAADAGQDAPLGNRSQIELLQFIDSALDEVLDQVKERDQRKH